MNEMSANAEPRLPPALEERFVSQAPFDPQAPGPSGENALARASSLALTWRKFKRNKAAVIAAVILLITYLAVPFAEVIAPYPRPSGAPTTSTPRRNGFIFSTRGSSRDPSSIRRASASTPRPSRAITRATRRRRSGSAFCAAARPICSLVSSRPIFTSSARPETARCSFSAPTSSAATSSRASSTARASRSPSASPESSSPSSSG